MRRTRSLGKSLLTLKVQAFFKERHSYFYAFYQIKYKFGYLSQFSNKKFRKNNFHSSLILIVTKTNDSIVFFSGG